MRPEDFGSDASDTKSYRANKVERARWLCPTGPTRWRWCIGGYALHDKQGHSQLSNGRRQAGGRQGGGVGRQAAAIRWGGEGRQAAAIRRRVEGRQTAATSSGGAVWRQGGGCAPLPSPPPPHSAPRPCRRAVPAPLCTPGPRCHRPR